MRYLTLKGFWFCLMVWLSAQAPTRAFTFEERYKVIQDFTSFFEAKHNIHPRVLMTDIVDLGDSILLNPDGMHFLYSYVKGREGFLRLDRSTFHGHNFGRSLYYYKNELYALGGYGFWHSHAKLLQFNRRTHEWDLMVTKGPIPEGSAILSFMRSDSVFFIRSINKGEMELGARVQSYLWILDMATLSWSKHPFDEDIHLENNEYRLTVESEKWYIGTTIPRAQETIVNKETGKFYINHNGPPLLGIPEWNENGLNLIANANAAAMIKGDSLIILVGDTLRYVRGNLNDFVFTFCKEENVFFNQLGDGLEEENPTESRMVFVSEKMIYWIALLMLVFLYGFERKNNRKSTASEFQFETGIRFVKSQPEEEPADLALALHNQGSHIWNQEQLDEFLGISTLDYNSKKLKRSRFLVDLNERHPGIVERQRDPLDKRRFIYKLDHKKFRG
jgi:hypothetical protein